MINILISLLHSRVGAVIQWLVGALVGWLAAQTVALGIEIPPAAWESFQVNLAGIGAFLVTFLVQWYQARQAIRLQQTAGVKPDAWIGENTLTAIESLIPPKK